jgi:hypothetical protein
MKLNNMNDQRLLIKANFKSSAIKGFFLRNPVMLIDKEDYLGAGYFYDSSNEPRVDIPYECNGFSYHKLQIE